MNAQIKIANFKINVFHISDVNIDSVNYLWENTLMVYLGPISFSKR